MLAVQMLLLLQLPSSLALGEGEPLQSQVDLLTAKVKKMEGLIEQLLETPQRKQSSSFPADETEQVTQNIPSHARRLAAEDVSAGLVLTADSDFPEIKFTGADGGSCTLMYMGDHQLSTNCHFIQNIPPSAPPSTPPTSPPPPPSSPPMSPPPPVYDSCDEILTADPTATSGVYTINLPQAGPQTVRCFMGDTGGWTMLASSLPEYSSTTWLVQDDASDQFWSSYYHMTQFSQIAFTSGDDSQSTPENPNRKEYDLSTCPSGSISYLVGMGSECGGLDFEFTFTHQACPLKARIGYETHTWDGGASGSIRGWGSNGYKTNNNVNCGKTCVIDCILNSGQPSGSSTSKMWVK